MFNKHGGASHHEAGLVMIVDQRKNGDLNFYIARPKALEDLVRERSLAFANRPKRDGTPRSIRFRKELPREVLAPWLEAWHLLKGLLD